MAQQKKTVQGFTPVKLRNKAGEERTATSVSHQVDLEWAGYAVVDPEKNTDLVTQSVEAGAPVKEPQKQARAV